MAAEAQDGLKPKSLVIALDGMRADGLADADAPRMHALMAGKWRPGYACASTYFAQTIKDAMTASGPNHTTIFTGVTAALHGVMKNDDTQMAAVKYPDYFALLKQSDPALHCARLSTWAPDKLEQSGADYVDVAKDAITAERADQILAGQYDNAAWPRGQDVDAMLVFLDNPDMAGHSSGFGPSNPKYLSALHTLDGEVGRMLDAVAARPNFARENWQIILTTDHGGYHVSHGAMEANCFNIPLAVCGRDVKQGQLAGLPANADVAPTVLQHMGCSPSQQFKARDGSVYTLAGHPEGAEIRAAEPHTSNDGLLARLSFDDGLADAQGRLHPVAGPSAPQFVEGKAGRAVHLSPGHFVTVAEPNALPLSQGDFSIAFWYRAPVSAARELMQKGPATGPVAPGADPVILGNQDWSDRNSPGFTVTASVGKGKNDLGVSVVSDRGVHSDLYRIDTKPGEWWFIAFSVRRDSVATLYAGGPDGRLQFVANDDRTLGNIASPLPLNLGQDGTGKYPFALTGDVDELSIWNRSLSLPDILTLYGNGN